MTPKEDHVVNSSRPLSRTASPVFDRGERVMDKNSPSPSSSSATARGDFASAAHAREVDSDEDDERSRFKRGSRDNARRVKMLYRY